MFKKSRRKIVAAIMSILVLLWVGTLGVIYAFSYIEMKHQNEQMLEAHAQMYTLSNKFEDMTPPDRPKTDGNHSFNPGFDPQSPMFQLSTFYTVAISYDGDVIEIKNEPPTVHTDEDLMHLAKKIMKSSKQTGSKDNLSFY